MSAPPGRAPDAVAWPPIEALVPQNPPMVLLDRMVAWEPGAARCEVTVREGAMFVREGRVASMVFVEYMAQAVAALVGQRDHLAGRPVRVGYLVGAREVRFFAEAASVGDQLRVDVAHLWGDDTVGSFHAELHRGDERLAAATLNVYRGDLEALRA